MAPNPAQNSKHRARQAYPILLVLLFCLGFVALGQSAKAADIALSLPLDGTYAQLGKQFSIGVKFAIDELPENNRPEIMTIDDGCTAEKGKAAAQAIAASEVRLAYGYLCNEPAFEAGRILLQSAIPVLVTGARAGRLTKDSEREGWHVFRASPSDGEAAQRAAEVFSKRWKGKRFAILDDGSLSTRTFSDEMRAWMEEAETPPALVATYRPDLERQSAMIAKLVAENIDAVFIAGSTSDFLTFALEIQVVDEKMEMAGSETLALLPLEIRANALEQPVYFIAEANPVDLPAFKPLLDHLQASQIEPDPMIFKGYAATKLALEALADSRAATLAKLQTEEFQTPLGPVKFDKDGANTHNPFQLFVFRDGKITRAE